MSKGDRAREQRARAKIAAIRAEEARRRRRRLWLAGATAAVVVIGAAVGITLAVTGGGGPRPGAPSWRRSARSARSRRRPPRARSGLSRFRCRRARAGRAVRHGHRADCRRDQLPGQRADRVPHPRPSDRLRERRGPAGPSGHRHPAGRWPSPPRPARSSPRGPASTGCIRTPPTASCTSSPRCTGPTPWATSSTSGASRWAPTRWARPAGHVVAIYNGQVFQGNPRDIPLTAHAQIQLQVGTAAGRAGADHVPERAVTAPVSGPGARRRAGRS